jgi:transcriptional regulator with XRE-family HTH domain
VIIGKQLRALRIRLGLTQDDIEGRTGLFRNYISRIENGHTVPSLRSLERIASALEVPLYRLFYDGEDSPQPPVRPSFKKKKDGLWGDTGAEGQELRRFKDLLAQMNDIERQFLMDAAQHMANAGRKDRRMKKQR